MIGTWEHTLDCAESSESLKALSERFDRAFTAKRLADEEYEIVSLLWSTQSAAQSTAHIRCKHSLVRDER